MKLDVSRPFTAFRDHTKMALLMFKYTHVHTATYIPPHTRGFSFVCPLALLQLLPHGRRLLNQARVCVSFACGLKMSFFQFCRIFKGDAHGIHCETLVIYGRQKDTTIHTHTLTVGGRNLKYSTSEK